MEESNLIFFMAPQTPATQGRIQLSPTRRPFFSAFLPPFPTVGVSRQASSRREGVHFGRRTQGVSTTSFFHVPVLRLPPEVPPATSTVAMKRSILKWFQSRDQKQQPPASYEGVVCEADACSVASQDVFKVRCLRATPTTQLPLGTGGKREGKTSDPEQLVRTKTKRALGEGMPTAPGNGKKQEQHLCKRGEKDSKRERARPALDS